MGSEDIPLNDQGLAQALSAGKLLKNEPINTIVTSPLLRARKTADIITRYLNVIEMPELQEACWGENEGKQKENGLWIDAWHKGHTIKNAEPYSDFAIRVKRGLEKALAHKGPVLITSHGGVYWALQEILDIPMIDLGNCDPIFHHPPQQLNHPWNTYPLSERNDLIGQCRT